jgi:uncharacterized protein YndB with AHSA1/START domain
MPHELEVSTPNDRDVVVTRLFDAPPRLVYECHTVPELVQRWMLGPPGWTMPVCEIDLRVGGSYRYVWRSEADGSEFGFRGDFLEIEAPRRLVHSERLDGEEPSEGGDSICTLLLAEEGGRTRLTYTMRYPTKEIRDQVLATGMTDGMAFGYDRLDEVMRERAVI